MTSRIREMKSADCPDVVALWRATQGLGLSACDSPGDLDRFLSRNPGASQVAVDGDALVGAVLCGHDGRRGYIHHLAVAADRRRSGIGRALVARCLAGLARDGIRKCHVFVFAENHGALEFWKRVGWSGRSELRMLSMMTAAQ